MIIVCETTRLIISEFSLDDADFVIQLLNEASFLHNIGDKGVRTREDAISYLKTGPQLSYQRHGFGLCLIRLRGLGTPIGMCGLLKRPELKYPDLGYALLPAFFNQGYALEAAESVLINTINKHALTKVLGITLPGNVPSYRLLEKLGFQHVGSIELYGAANRLYEYSTPNIAF